MLIKVVELLGGLLIDYSEFIIEPTPKTILSKNFYIIDVLI